MREFLRSDRRVYIKDESDCRNSIGAIVRINRTGAAWRDLPEKFGKSNNQCC
ncbi:MAG: transposase [Chloroflexi bacterium]|nr:transposase [Chloroflexota bacterium]